MRPFFEVCDKFTPLAAAAATTSCQVLPSPAYFWSRDASFLQAFCAACTTDSEVPEPCVGTLVGKFAELLGVTVVMASRPTGATAERPMATACATFVLMP